MSATEKLWAACQAKLPSAVHVAVQKASNLPRACRSTLPAGRGEDGQARGTGRAQVWSGRAAGPLLSATAGCVLHPARPSQHSPAQPQSTPPTWLSWKSGVAQACSLYCLASASAIRDSPTCKQTCVSWQKCVSWHVCSLHEGQA